MNVSTPTVCEISSPFPQPPRTTSPRRTIGHIAAAVLAAMLSVGATAQTATSAKVTGSYSGSLGVGSSVQGEFSCSGTPTCTGQYREVYRLSQCSNQLINSDAITVTGLNLARSGSLEGNFNFKNRDFRVDSDHHEGGSCSIRLGTYQDSSVRYTGSWDLATAAGTFTLLLRDIPGTFKADILAPAPVFQMVIRSNIDSGRANAVADIQFRPQDVGTYANIYTFAVAPASLVKGGLEKYATLAGYALSEPKADPPTACVVAQVNSSGQLIAVTGNQLQAYSSGTLSASGASVTILSNASTPTVAGATFYVGYGTSSGAMLTNGIYRNAITVPGSSVCPMLSSQTALWWNPAESGWGVNFNHQGNTLFGTLFTYDSSRAPLWLVMSNGAMQSDGLTFTGDLYRTTGPAFNANPFTPIGAANVTKVGTMTASFVDVNSGTLRYTVNGVEVNKGIQRQVYGTRAAACFPTIASRASATNYQDLWWNPAESGWGINITHQDTTLFATLFTYDESGKTLWLVMPAGTLQSDGSYSGALYQTAGPVFNTSPFTGVTAATVGTMRLAFSDGESGTLTYTYNGVTVTKAITRQLFSSPVPGCY